MPFPTVTNRPGTAPVTMSTENSASSSTVSCEVVQQLPQATTQVPQLTTPTRDPIQATGPVTPNLAYPLEPVGKNAHQTPPEVIDPAVVMMLAQFSEPITVQTAVKQNSTQVNALNVGSAMQQLHAANFMMRNVVQPVFSGQADDYESFMADFETFVSKISGGAPVSDESMLNYLEPCLPEPLRRHVTTQRQNTRNAYTFAQMKTFLDQRFGDDITEATRRKWEQIDLPKSGKILSMDFLGFETEFRAARARVKDATDTEARRLLISKLPPSLSKYIFDEEEKRNTYNPQLEVVGIPGMVNDGISATILASTKVSPKKVEHQGGGTFLVTVRSLLERDQVLELHGRVVARTGRSFSVKSVRKELSYEEVFTLLRTKLATRERTDALQKASCNRAVRQTRAKIANVENDSDSDEEEKLTVKNPKTEAKQKGGNAQNARGRSQSPSTSKSPVQQGEQQKGPAGEIKRSFSDPTPQNSQSSQGGSRNFPSAPPQYWNQGKGANQGWQGKGNSNPGAWGGRGKGVQNFNGKGYASGNAWNASAQNSYFASSNRPMYWNNPKPPVLNPRGPPVASNFGKGKGKGNSGAVGWPRNPPAAPQPQNNVQANSNVNKGSSTPESSQQ